MACAPYANSRPDEKDAHAFRALRLEALQREPLSFGQSAEEHQSLTIAKIAARLRANSVKGSFLLGAFETAELIATAGFARNPETKKSHKGMIWGVYVKEPHRGKKHSAQTPDQADPPRARPARPRANHADREQRRDACQTSLRHPGLPDLRTRDPRAQSGPRLCRRRLHGPSTPIRNSNRAHQRIFFESPYTG